MTALLILSILSLAVLSATLILIAVKLSEALTKSVYVTDRAHERWVKQTDRLLDRLVTRNWEEYAALRELDEPNTGGFFEPAERDEDEDDEVPLPKSNVRFRWGAADDTQEFTPRSADEEKIMSEDFDDEGEPLRRVPHENR